MEINSIAANMQNKAKEEYAEAHELGKKDANDLTKYLGEGSKLGQGDHVVWAAEHINMLLVGRSQTGKSTIVETMKFPQKGTKSNGFSDTKEPGFYPLILHDKARNLSFQLNIIDTPGLQEVHENDKSRSDTELLKLATVCVERHITSLNAVCFVSRAGETHRNDVVVFDSVRQFLGNKFADISMMILTHSDEFGEKDLKEFERNIHDHKISKPISEYCKLGIARYGAINHTMLEQFPEPEVKTAVVGSKLARIEIMRRDFINKIISCADKGKPITDLQAIYEERERANKDLIDRATKAVYEEQERSNQEKEMAAKAMVEARERANKAMMDSRLSTIKTASMVGAASLIGYGISKVLK